MRFMCTIILRDRLYDAKIFRWAASETYLCNNRLISKKCGHTHENIFTSMSRKCYSDSDWKPWTTWRKAFLEIVGNVIGGISQRSKHLIDLCAMIPRLWYAIIIVRLLNPLARLIVLICCVISNFCVIFNKSMNYFVSTPTFISVRSQDFQFLHLLF